MEGKFLRLLFAILLSEHRKAPAAGAESVWADEPSIRDCKEQGLRFAQTNDERGGAS